MDELRHAVKRATWSATIVLIGALPGCHLLQPTTVGSQFPWEDIDAMVLVASPQDLDFSSSYLQREIREICQSADWEPSTVPLPAGDRTIRCLDDNRELLKLRWTESGELIAQWPDGTVESTIPDEADTRQLKTVIDWRLCRDALDRLLETPPDGTLVERSPDNSEAARQLIPTYQANVPDGIQHHLHVDDEQGIVWITESGGFAGMHKMHGPWKKNDEHVRTLLQRLANPISNREDISLPSGSS